MRRSTAVWSTLLNQPPNTKQPPDGAPFGSPMPRLRFVSAKLARGADSTVRVQVKIKQASCDTCFEMEGVGLEAVELRLAAQATLAAVREATGNAASFSLVGIKRLHVFDADVVLVSLQDANHGGRPLVGVMPVRERLVEAAALAVLNAVPVAASSERVRAVA